MATRTFCDRCGGEGGVIPVQCGQHSVALYGQNQIGNIQCSFKPLDATGGDLCESCQRDLKKFFKPLPREAIE